MATSYANAGGTGDRTALITVTLTGASGSGGSPSVLVNGNLTESVFWFAGPTAVLRFQFPSAKVIDEAKFYQDNATAHGSWKWQGSADGAAWSDIGSAFTLGGTTVQTITALAGNTTGYLYYRLVSAGGSFSSSPWVREFEFKIDDAPVAPAAVARADTFIWMP